MILGMRMLFVLITSVAIAAGGDELSLLDFPLDQEHAKSWVASMGMSDQTLQHKGQSFPWADVFSLDLHLVTFLTPTGAVGVRTKDLPIHVTNRLGIPREVIDIKERILATAGEISALAERERLEREATEKAEKAKAKALQDQAQRAKAVIRQIVDGGALVDMRMMRRVERMTTVTALGHKEPRKFWSASPDEYCYIAGDFSGRVDGEDVSLWVVRDGTYQYDTVAGSVKTVRKYMAVTMD